MSLQLSAIVRRGGFVLEARADIPASGLTLITGPSGAGKTSLLRLIAGLDRASEGKVSLGADTLDAPDEKVFVPTWRRGFGVAFQDARLFPHLDVKANILFALEEPPADWDGLIAALDLGALLHRRVAGLSGGERQRVSLARALARPAKLLLLDEPTAMVDDARRRRIDAHLRAVADRTPMLLVSHETERMRPLADQVLVVEHGRLSGPFSNASGVVDLAARGGS